MGEKITRREFIWLSLLAGLGIWLPACSTNAVPHRVPPATFPPTTDSEAERLDLAEKIRQEVARLAKTYAVDSVPYRVYLSDGTSEQSSAFPKDLHVDLVDQTDHASYATTFFGPPTYTNEFRFTYTKSVDNKTVNYQTLEGLGVSVLFSSEWLNSSSEEVKRIVLEKEAYTIAQWSTFAKIVLNAYKSQGVITAVDPTVTEGEIADILAFTFGGFNLQFRKLFDYGPYLLFMPRVRAIIDSGDPEEIAALHVTNMHRVYDLAVKNGMTFDTVPQFGTDEYWNLILRDPTSLWVKTILDPSIAGPTSLLPSLKRSGKV